MTEYYARCNEDRTKYQTITDHLTNVSILAGIYAQTFTTREMGEICGILHDIGKYSDDFQKRIRGDNIQTDHSTAGAKTADLLAAEQHNPYSSLAYHLMSYIIAGHHGGLPNRGHANASGLFQRLQSSDPKLLPHGKTRYLKHSLISRSFSPHKPSSQKIHPNSTRMNSLSRFFSTLTSFTPVWLTRTEPMLHNGMDT